MSNHKLRIFTENVISLFAIKAIDLGLTIGLIPFLILKVGLDNYGIYAFAMALMLFFANLLNYGFDYVAVRALAKHSHHSEKLSTIVSEVISVKIVLLFGVVVMVIILGMMIPLLRNHTVVYLFSAFLLFNEVFALRWFFLGLENNKYAAAISLIGSLLYVVLVLIFIKVPEDYYLIPLLEVIGTLPLMALAFWLVVKKYQIKLQWIPLAVSWQYIKTHFSSFVNLLLPSTLGSIIVFLVGIFALPFHVSYVQLGVKWSNAFSTVNTILTKVFYTMVNKTASLQSVSKKVLLAGGVGSSMVMYATAPLLIEYWLKLSSNTDQTRIIYIVRILSPIPFLMAVTSSYGINGLMSQHKDWVFSKITLTATMITILVSIGFIPVYNYYGAIIALLLGRAVQALLSYVAHKKLGL